MSRTLGVSVHVHRPDGSTAVYAAGDEVSADDAKLIANKDVWAAEKAESKSSK